MSVEDQAHIVKELSDIEQARILEEAYRNVEGPKFFLDFSEVNRVLATFLESSFERYCSFRAYEEKGGQLAADTELLELAKSGAAVTQLHDKKAETSDVLLGNLATIVFMEYLWNSERGVNATLSTRIRHGSLENQLKRVFGAHRLLATKDLQGNFQCEKQVMNVLSACTEPERLAVQEAYVAFTKDIGGIYESLITETLRVQVPPGIVALVEQQGLPAKESATDRGLLNFCTLFSEQTTTRLKAIHQQSVSALLTEMESIFATQARNAFAEVQSFLGNRVSASVTTAIDCLDTVVVRTLDDGPTRATLRTDILAAKDGFAHDLRVIQNWFSAAERLHTGTSTVKELISTAARVVGFASNGKLGRVSARNVMDEAVAPESGVVLYEVLSILLRNIVQHSVGVIEQEVVYDYDVLETGGRVLTLRNRMASEEACVLAVESAMQRLAEPHDPRVLDRSPGGTGLARIHALLGQCSTREVEVNVWKDTGHALFCVSVAY